MKIKDFLKTIQIPYWRYKSCYNFSRYQKYLKKLKFLEASRFNNFQLYDKNYESIKERHDYYQKQLFRANEKLSYLRS